MKSEDSGTWQDNQWKLQLFSGFRLRTPSGTEFQSKSRRMVSLITFLALQRDFAYDRRRLAFALYSDYEDNHEQRLKLLLSRTSGRLKHHGHSFLKVTSDSVWLDTSILEIDLQIALQLFDSLVDAKEQGKRIKGIYSTLGELISPITTANELPCVDDALTNFKSNLLHQVVTKVVPISGVEYANYVSAIVETLGLEDYESATNCAQLMSIYAGIGDKGAIHRVFSRHEMTLDAEYGEAVGHATHEAYALALQLEPYHSEEASIEETPPKPDFSVGFTETIDRIIKLIESSRRQDIIHLVGCAGSGKTHLLAQLYHTYKGKGKISFIDLSAVDEIKSLINEISGPVECLILDNLEPYHESSLREITRMLGTSVIVSAGSSACSVHGTINIPVPPLEGGNRLQLGSGGLLFAANFGLKDANLLSLENGQVLSNIQELVDLSGGNPATIQSCAELGKILGLEGVVQYIKSDLTGLLPKTNQKRAKSSLRNHYISRVESLDSEAIKALQLLNRVNEPILSELLVVAGHIEPDVLIDLSKSGFVKNVGDGIVEVILPLKEILGSSAIGTIDPSTWNEFCSATLLWVTRKAESPSENLIVARILPSLCAICKWLLDGDRRREGLQMYCLISSWFVSSDFDEHLPSRAEAVLLSLSDLKPKEWSKSIHSIGKGYIAKGNYSRGLTFLNWALNCYSFQCLSDQDQYPLWNLLGLVNRCLGKFEVAETLYLKALSVVPNEDAHVTVFFNLGCMFEGQGQLKEALRNYESAVSYYSKTVDSRLLIQNTVSILRLRLELSPNVVNISETLDRLYKDTLISRDNRSQATLLMDVGELKLKSGQQKEALFYLVTGILMFLDLGYTLNTASKCLPSLKMLRKCIAITGLTNLASHLDVLADSMEAQLSTPAPVSEDEVEVIFPRVLREVLLECLQASIDSGLTLPPELDRFINGAEALKAISYDFIPVVPFLEKLRATQARKGGENSTPEQLSSGGLGANPDF